MYCGFINIRLSINFSWALLMTQSKKSNVHPNIKVENDI